MVSAQCSHRPRAAGARARRSPGSAAVARAFLLAVVVSAWTASGPKLTFAPGRRGFVGEASATGALSMGPQALTTTQVNSRRGGQQKCPTMPAIVRCAARKKAAAGGTPICDGDTVYIKVQTGRYIGELDGTSRKEWVKARGTKKDKDHALTIEKNGGGEIASGDTIRLAMPLTVTNGTKIHIDVLGSAVRARYYDPRGEWQKLVIVKQEGGVIKDGDKIFIRSVFMNGRDYLDANPLEKIADGEVKCRWPDEGEWQAMTIEK